MMSENIDIFGLNEPEIQKVIIGSELLPLYMSGEALMVNLSNLGLRDTEFGLMAELVGAAGVALVCEDDEVLDHVDAARVMGSSSYMKYLEKGGVKYIKFLSWFEMEVYDEVKYELWEKRGCAVNLDLYSASGRMEECLYRGGYVKSINECLEYASYPDEVSSEWVEISNMLAERVREQEINELERARRAREAEEEERKHRFGKAADKALLKVADLLFGKRYPY